MSDERQYMHDVYGPASCWDHLPEGTTVGTSACANFVGFSVGFSKEHLLTPDEAEALAALFQEAARKCRQRHEEAKTP